MVLEQRTYREMKFYKSTKQGTKKKKNREIKVWREREEKLNKRNNK
jgi:hypothetical protein